MPIVQFTVGPCSGCCAQCHDLWGDHLVLVISGVDLSCFVGVCFVGPNGKFYEVTSTTGINGTWDAVWPLGPGWAVVVGTLTFQEYVENTCLTETGAPFTLDLLAGIRCTDNLVNLAVNTVGFPGGAGEVPVFQNTGEFALDATIPNLLTPCPGGNATVSLP